MKSRLFYSILLFVFAFLSAHSQNANRGIKKVSKDSVLNKITNIDHRLQSVSVADSSISVYSIPQTLYDSLLVKFPALRLKNVPRDSAGIIIPPQNNWTPFDSNVSFADTTLVDPAFLPIVFDGRSLSSNTNFLSDWSFSKKSDIGVFHLIAPDSTFENQLEKVEKTRQMRQNYLMSNPRKVRYNAFTFGAIPTIEEEVVKKRNPFQEMISTEKPIDIITPELDKIGIREVFWKKSGEHKLQLSTDQFSDNWNSDNNLSLNNYHKFILNYKKKKISFNNTIEWRLNMIRTSSKDDSNIKHKTRVTEDFFRTYSTFGIDAYKNWSYSSNLEIKTPLFNKFNAKDDNKTRALFSPLEINVGLGMRYSKEKTNKLNKYRKLKVSADIALLSLNHKFVGDGLVDATQFGIEKGDKRITDYGSTLNFNLSYSHNRFTNYTSRLKYFTSYEKVQVEFENSFDFKLNNYFSTTLYTYWKYNDDIDPKKKDPKWGYFMYNYRILFGLSYTW